MFESSYNVSRRCRSRVEVKERKKSEEDINGLFYNFSIEEDDRKKDDKEKIEEAIKNKIYSKISNLLPEDIIANVKDGKIKEQYYKEKR